MAPNLLEKYLADLKDQGRASWTLQKYRIALGQFFGHIGARPLDSLTPDDLRRYLRTFDGLATRRWHTSLLRNLYAFYLREGLSSKPDYNPARLVAFPKEVERAPRPVHQDDEERLFAAAEVHGEVYLMMCLMRYSGLRVFEVVGEKRKVLDPYTGKVVRERVSGLRIGDVDWQNLSVIVRGKGGSEKAAMLTPLTAALLRQHVSGLRHVQPEYPVFQDRHGGPRGTDWARAWFRRLRARAGIESRVTPHMMRHSAGTKFLEKTGDLEATKQFLRHKKIATTLVYAGNSTRVLRGKFDSAMSDDHRKKQ